MQLRFEHILHELASYYFGTWWPDSKLFFLCKKNPLKEPQREVKGRGLVSCLRRYHCFPTSECLLVEKVGCLIIKCRKTISFRTQPAQDACYIWSTHSRKRASSLWLLSFFELSRWIFNFNRVVTVCNWVVTKNKVRTSLNCRKPWKINSTEIKTYCILETTELQTQLNHKNHWFILLAEL